MLNHAAPYSDRIRASNGFWDQPALVGQFVRRGLAVIVPARHGFGATGGRYAEDYGGCVDPDYRHGGLLAANELVAALHYAARLPFVDGPRIILAGQSAGGFSSIAAASLAAAWLNRGCEPLQRSRWRRRAGGLLRSARVGGIGILMIQPAVRSGHSELLTRESAAIWGRLSTAFSRDTDCVECTYVDVCVGC